MVGKGSGVLIRGFVVLSMVVALLVPAAGVQAEFETPLPDLQLSEPVARFEWWVPARTGLDVDDDGVIDSRTTRLAVGAPEEGWQVNFNACGSSATSSGATIVDFNWYVDRAPVDSPDSINGNCGGFTYYFPEEGKYEITLEVVDSAGQEHYVIEDITVQDWLIVALGDSFGSGQGNPDIAMEGADLDRVWAAAADVVDRLAELTDLEDDYEATAAQVDSALAAYRELLSALLHQVEVCDFLGSAYDWSACTDEAPTRVSSATTALANALSGLGMTFSIELLDSVEGLLDGLRDVADRAVQAAEQAWLGAVGAFETATADASPVWQDRRCNRSAISGQAMAALALEQADPHTSVTFVHLSCSGAEILTGLLGPYAGVEPPEGARDLPPQVERARSLVGGREVDAVLLSIGGNDVGFGPIVEACIFQEPCHDDNLPVINEIDAFRCDVSQSFGAVFLLTDQTCRSYLDDLYDRHAANPAPAKGIFDAKSALLPDNYATLATSLAAAFPAVEESPGRVFITEYPNAMQDQSGNLCVSTADNSGTMLPGITPGESAWLRNTVTTRLNEMVGAAASSHEWTYVGGIYSAFAAHGYCSTSEWFRRMQDSFVMQETMMGAVHPNRNGHELIGERAFAALRAALYPDDGGIGTPTFTLPRLPNLTLRPVVSGEEDTTPPNVVGVPDPSANIANNWYAAPVLIDWQATDPAPSSGIPEDPADTLAALQGENTYESGLSCDLAGNCAAGEITLSIDTMAPEVVGRAGRLNDGQWVEVKPNDSGWFNSPVIIRWEATDPAPGSGVEISPVDQEASANGSDVAHTSESCDLAGNCATGTVKLSIDKYPPSVACPSTPVFQVGASEMVTAQVWDWLSRPVEKIVSAPADTATVGRKTVSLTGWDRAGNSTTVDCDYLVEYAFGGFSEPVDGDEVLNVAKAGRVIPLKWRLTDAAGAPILGLPSATISVTGYACSEAVTSDVVGIMTTSGASGLQNLGDGWYQLNWKTPISYAGCRVLRLDLGEGLVRTALFQFKK